MLQKPSQDNESLTGFQRKILTFLLTHLSPSGANEHNNTHIATRVGTTKNQIQKQITALVRADILSREINHSGSRTTRRLYLTKHGSAIIREEAKLRVIAYRSFRKTSIDQELIK